MNIQLWELKELGERALACEHWAWMPGMVTIGGSRVWGLDDGRPVGTNGSGLYTLTGIPDLSDAATLGCVLELVQRAWSDPGVGIGAKYEEHAYTYHVTPGHHHGAKFAWVSGHTHGSAAAALVFALEHASCVRSGKP